MSGSRVKCPLCRSFHPKSSMKDNRILRDVIQVWFVLLFDASTHFMLYWPIICAWGLFCRDKLVATSIALWWCESNSKQALQAKKSSDNKKAAAANKNKRKRANSKKKSSSKTGKVSASSSAPVTLRRSARLQS